MYLRYSTCITRVQLVLSTHSFWLVLLKFLQKIIRLKMFFYSIPLSVKTKRVNTWFNVFL